MSPRVVALRRYPVKSMGGEALRRVNLDARGIVGDRWFAVEDGEGRFASGKNTHRFRRRDQVFGYFATTTSRGVQVRGLGGRWMVGDPALEADLTSRMGLEVRVTPETSISHQDAGSVSLIGTATLRWCADRWNINADPRRLRVNIVVETDEPFIEERWGGRVVSIGTAALTVTGQIERCRMIDIRQDGATPDGRWLRPLAAERQLRLAMYADVGRPGTISLGESLTLPPA